MKKVSAMIELKLLGDAHNRFPSFVKSGCFPPFSLFPFAFDSLDCNPFPLFQELLVEVPVILVERGDHDGQVGQSTGNVEESRKTPA